MSQTDNEKILELVQEAEEYMQGLMRRLLDAHITPFAFNTIVHAWQCISSCYATTDLPQNRPIASYGIGAAIAGGQMCSLPPEDSEIEEFLAWRKIKEKQLNDSEDCANIKNEQ